MGWGSAWLGKRSCCVRVAGVFLAGGDSPRAATSVSCQSLAEVSSAAKKSGGDESGVSWERRTATVRKHVLLFVLLAVVGNPEFFLVDFLTSGSMEFGVRSFCE
jgi:hypothetical protein